MPLGSTFRSFSSCLHDGVENKCDCLPRMNMCVCAKLTRKVSKIATGKYHEYIENTTEKEGVK